MKIIHRLMALAIKLGLSYEFFVSLRYREIMQVIDQLLPEENKKKKEKVDLSNYTAPDFSGVEINDFYQEVKNGWVY